MPNARSSSSGSDVASPRVGSRLAEEYKTILRDYLDGAGEAALKRAYQLGTRALAEDGGAVDLIRVHHEALLSSPTAAMPEGCARMVEVAARLFVECMTPLETAHRAYRETHAALQASEERYRELFENANDVVFTADLDGHLTSINRAGECLSGYDRSEVLSLDFTSIVAPEHTEVARRARELKVSGEEESTRYELEILTKAGRRIPLEVNTRLIYRDGRPVGVQGIARDVIERKKAERALRRMNVRLEEEARRIAHALHDEAGQVLASVYLAVAELAAEVPPPARARLDHLTALLDQVAEQLRHISHELRPVLLDDLGLVPALEFMAQGVSKRSGLSVAIEASIEGRLPALIETAVYRILQETLSNVSRHARACRVEVRLQATGRTIHYSISDDGIGFDPSAICPNGDQAGLGLIGIRERLADLGGSLAIITGAGQGTTLEMSIPLDASVVPTPRRS